MLLTAWHDLCRARPISVKSPLPPDAVVANLDDAAGPVAGADPDSGTGGGLTTKTAPGDHAGRIVVGHVSIVRVRLLAQRPSRRRLRNPWRPVLRGRIVPTPGGSRLVGSFAWLSGVRVATAAWLVAVIGFLVAGVTTAAGQSAVTVLVLLAPGIAMAVAG